MAEPKKKRSKTRTRLARATKFVKFSQLTACKQCQAKILPHTVCKYCGYYKGKNILK